MLSHLCIISHSCRQAKDCGWNAPVTSALLFWVLILRRQRCAWSPCIHAEDVPRVLLPPWNCLGAYHSGSSHCDWNLKPRAQPQVLKVSFQGSGGALSVGCKEVVSCSCFFVVFSSFCLLSGHRRVELPVSLCRTEELSLVTRVPLWLSWLFSLHTVLFIYTFPAPPFSCVGTNFGRYPNSFYHHPLPVQRALQVHPVGGGALCCFWTCTSSSGNL